MMIKPITMFLTFVLLFVGAPPSVNNSQKAVEAFKSEFWKQNIISYTECQKAENEPCSASDELYCLGEYLISAYCGCEACCEKSDGITATGTIATEGRTIAVDPDVIPYGTEVMINGRWYIAEDCGGAIDGNRIDMFFDLHEDALNWGLQYFDVWIK